MQDSDCSDLLAETAEVMTGHTVVPPLSSGDAHIEGRIHQDESNNKSIHANKLNWKFYQ